MDKGVLQDLQHETGLGEDIHFEVQVHLKKIRVSNFTSQRPGISPPFSCSIFFLSLGVRLKVGDG